MNRFSQWIQQAKQASWTKIIATFCMAALAASLYPIILIVGTLAFIVFMLTFGVNTFTVALASFAAVLALFPVFMLFLASLDDLNLKTEPVKKIAKVASMGGSTSLCYSILAICIQIMPIVALTSAVCAVAGWATWAMLEHDKESRKTKVIGIKRNNVVNPVPLSGLRCPV